MVRVEGRATSTLVAIYLRGGADFLNMVIPYSSPSRRPPSSRSMRLQSSSTIPFAFSAVGVSG